MARILVVDDEPGISHMIACALEPQGYAVETASSGISAIEMIQGQQYDVVITDVMMPGADGFAVLDAARQSGAPPSVIIITGFGSVSSAVEAMKRGAAEYITKPLDVARLIERVGDIVRSRRQDEERGNGEGRADFEGMVGRSEAMERLCRLIEHVAASPSTVLICGESGSGKELVARAIHALSSRAHGPFVAVECGALAETLLESELFGHVRGAFTGAVVDKVGLFEAADGGTLFLDEVGELAPRMQQRLLRCIQERAVRAIGSTAVRKVDVRIISATHRDLTAMVEAKQFRQDLYYRLNVVPVPVPPLCERRDDIPVLAEHFARKYARRVHRRTPKISETVIRMLTEAEWPGNVRQLENVIECAVTFSEGDVIRPEHLSADFIESFALSKSPPAVPDRGMARPARAAGRPKPADITPLGAAIRYLESQMLSKALDASNGNKEQAANLLGIDRATLYRKLKAHGLAGQ